MIYERIKALCKKKGISVNQLEKELSISRGALCKIDTNKPGGEKLQKLSDYFGVSIEYLMTGEDSNKAGPSAKDERDIAKDLENIMRKMKNGENGPASFEGEEIPEEDLELFAGQLELMPRRLKSINKEKYNPYKNKK